MNGASTMSDDTEVPTLTDFLLARIAEDESYVIHNGRAIDCEDALGLHLEPQRAVAECDAKRRIVEWSQEVIDVDGGIEVLRMLALPYADHPDYREEWRP